MRPVSPQLAALVRQSHARRYEVTAHLPDGTTQILNTVVAGALTFDTSRTSGLRAGSLTIVGEEAIPASEDHPVAPFGQYLTVEFIYDLPTGPERVNVGQFLVLAAETERPDKRVRVTLGDWAYRVDRAVLESALDWGPDVLLEEVIRYLLETGAGRPLTLISDLGNATVGGEGFLGNLGESRWALAYNLADSVDRSIQFLDRDTVRILTRAGIGIAEEELNTGERGVIVRAQSGISSTSAYNRVVVTVESGAGDSPSYRAERTLTTGPMAYDAAGFGQYPLTASYRVENATQAQADAYADYLFARQAGAARQFDLDCIPMPWLEATDTVLISGPQGQELAVVESLTLPLEAEGLMSVTTRANRTQTPGPFRGRQTQPALLGAS